MAKKGYPGLVLVPPSDRTILRRRLLHVALFVIAMIWCASALNIWSPASDDKANCLSMEGQEGPNSSADTCGQSQSVTEAPPSPREFSLTTVSQAEGLGESQNSPPSLTSTLDTDRLATQNNRSQGSQPKSHDPANHPSDHHIAPPGHEQSVSSPPPSKTTESPDIDTRLAEQGDAFAQYRLGRYYALHDGRQTPESVRWYKKASPGLHRLAETGNGQAMYVLGVMYAYGRGVGRNTEEARRWLTQAVENKIAAAQPVIASLDKQRSADPKSQVNAQNNR